MSLPEITTLDTAADKVLVLIPTYNERENLPVIVSKVRSAVPHAHILVLDDNSPDGTGALADEIAGNDDHVMVLHRTAKEGLGKAYLEGFAWGLDRGYDRLVEMDADGSHPAQTLPTLLEAARHADLVIGSRWIRGGRVVNWPLSRKALSVGGNIYIKTLLGMGVNDATAGYRVYTASALHTIGLQDVASYGYCFQADLTWRAVRSGLTVVEVPITFVEREIGESKMNPDIARESLLNITQWGIAYRTDQAKALVGKVGRRVVGARRRVTS